MTWTEPRKNLGCVLVIDHEENVRKLIRLTLMKGGYDVMEAADGAEAVELLTSEDPAVAVDAIICDIRLPKVNGAEAVSYFCQQFPFVPMMAITGFPDIRLAISLLKQGALYIPKPIDGDKLLTYVARAMERRAALTA